VPGGMPPPYAAAPSTCALARSARPAARPTLLPNQSGDFAGSFRRMVKGSRAIDHLMVSGGGSGGIRTPVSLGTLTFKVCEAAYGNSRGSCYRWSRLSTTVARTVVNGHE
jgi:hypothetical protein